MDAGKGSRSAVFGVEPTTVTVVVNVDSGLGYHLVGLPNRTLKESSFRIAAALKNVGRSFPGKRLALPSIVPSHASLST